MVRNARFVVGVLAAAGLVALSAGCQNQLRVENDKLRLAFQDSKAQEGQLARENAELKARVAELETKMGPKTPEVDPAALGAELDSGFEVTTRSGLTVINLISPFDVGSDQLSSKGKAEVAKLAGVLRSRFPDRIIRVEGHTDSDKVVKHKDKFRNNRVLSMFRAETVVDALVKAGLAADKVYPAGWGEHQPLASNKTPAGKAKNRRVEIVILPGTGRAM